MEKATERPWKLGDSKKDGMSFTRQIETSLMGHCSIGYTEAPSGSEVMIKRSEANAALIVRAVNSHEALTNALAGMLEAFTSVSKSYFQEQMILQAKAAIRLAKGA